MFLILDILFQYWIERVTFGLLYAMFRFSTKIFYRGLPGFVTDCPCGVGCPGLTTCLLLHDGPLSVNVGWLIGGLYVWHNEEQLFIVFNYVFTFVSMPSIPYFRLLVSSVLYIWHSNLVLSFYTDVVLTFWIWAAFPVMHTQKAHQGHQTSVTCRTKDVNKGDDLAPGCILHGINNTTIADHSFIQFN